MKSIKCLILACLICLPLLNAAAQQNSQKGPPPQQTQMQSPGVDADKLITLGDYYYRSLDVSDAADRYYKQAIRNSPGSEAAGLAQYNRGSYWFRKFYVVREQYSKDDYSSLTQAEAHYYDFIDKVAKETNTIELLSDAEFNLALVYLQQGKRNYAIGWLNRMLSEAVPADKSVYIDKVVWSSKPGDIVDRKVDAQQLATFARKAIEKEDDIDDAIRDIKHWCKKQ